MIKYQVLVRGLMGSRGFLIGTIIAGIAVMLALSSIPVYADHVGGHAGKCPGTWVSITFPINVPPDINGNAVVCKLIKGNGQFILMDDILHPNNP